MIGDFCSVQPASSAIGVRPTQKPIFHVLAPVHERDSVFDAAGVPCGENLKFADAFFPMLQ